MDLKKKNGITAWILTEKKIVTKNIKDKESQKIRKITQELYLQTTVSLVTLSVYNET